MMVTAVLLSRPPGHAEYWPLVSGMKACNRQPSAVSGCRHYTARQLRAWNLDHLADTAQLVVNELVTNALVHGAGPVTVSLRANSESLLISVRDTHPALPEPRSHAIDAAGGRGLEIISLLSQSWGCYPEGSRKTVWALLSKTRPR